MSHFREIKWGRGSRVTGHPGSVKITFVSFKRSVALVLTMGKQILKELDIADNGRIQFFVYECNPRWWMIKKSANQQGYNANSA